MVNENTMYGTLDENRRTWYVECILHSICKYAKEMYIKLTEILLMKGEGIGHILRRFCTYFKMRRKYTYSKKVLYIFSINAKDLRRCEGCAKEIYTPIFFHDKNQRDSSPAMPKFYSMKVVCLPVKPATRNWIPVWHQFWRIFSL